MLLLLMVFLFLLLLEQLLPLAAAAAAAAMAGFSDAGRNPGIASKRAVVSRQLVCVAGHWPRPLPKKKQS